MKSYCIATAVLAVFLVGCGGGGGTSAPSPFVGTWAGTWTGGGEDGTGVATIALNGNFAGTVHNNTQSLDGTIQGRISNGGSISGTLTYAGYLPVVVSGTMALSNVGTTLSGTILIDGTASVFSLTLQ